MEICKPHTKCRACGSTKLNRYLNLGSQPLSNNLEDTPEKSMGVDRYPLSINLCESCGLSQLSVVVAPEKLFAHYTYRSSINAGYVKHCRQMAIDLQEEYDLNEESFVVDIAGNDCALLKEFKEQIGCQVLNIDPAKNLVQICEEKGISQIDDFWDEETAELVDFTWGKADAIIATNVFAHVDDIKGFLKGAKSILKENGVLIIECPYFPAQMTKMDYTQTYHEHLSYITVTPIFHLCKETGLRIIDLQEQSIHGGTIRFIIAHDNSRYQSKTMLKWFLEYERDAKYLEPKTYIEWANKIYDIQDNIGLSLTDLKWDEKVKLAAFSASAKGNVLLNTTGLWMDIDYIVDETPEKQGKFSPGTDIPIAPIDKLLSEPPDYLLLLSYNFKDEIIEKCRKFGYKGRFIVPFPQLEII